MAFDALTTAIRTARQLQGTPIVYRRGLHGVALVAIVGQTPVERDDGQGTVVRSRVRDYLIEAADLVLDGERIEPAKGDQIEETVGNQRFTYEVLPLGKEPPWRFSGPSRNTYRIHTKQTGSDEVP